ALAVHVDAHGTWTSRTLDHVVPRSRGGKDAWENLVWSSKTVNARNAPPPSPTSQPKRQRQTEVGNRAERLNSAKKSGLSLSEKRIHISDNRFCMKMANPIDRAMLARIKSRGESWVFSPTDFLDLGSRDAVDKALSRMAATGKIRRVARGLYDVPRHHPI